MMSSKRCYRNPGQLPVVQPVGKPERFASRCMGGRVEFEVDMTKVRAASKVKPRKA